MSNVAGMGQFIRGFDTVRATVRVPSDLFAAAPHHQLFRKVVNEAVDFTMISHGDHMRRAAP